VPSSPPAVAGVLNVRGDLVAVVDLAAALGLGETALPDSRAPGDALVVLVESSHGNVGILVDEVLGVRRLALSQLDQPLARDEAARGVADGAIVLLELEHLLSAQRFGNSEQ
jgi:purine-binding chemotaxis protein CheW